MIIISFQTIILFDLFLFKNNMAQSAGAAEYTDCISAEG